jgi:hypothetical protein
VLGAAGNQAGYQATPIRKYKGAMSMTDQRGSDIQCPLLYTTTIKCRQQL